MALLKTSFLGALIAGDLGLVSLDHNHVGMYNNLKDGQVIAATRTAFLSATRTSGSVDSILLGSF